MPFLAGFNKRKAIKYGTVKPGGNANLTAFSLLIKISGDTDLGAELSSRKCAVTLADGTTQVGYGTLKYNETSGAVDFILRAKFDLSSSASTGDVIGYLYYDDTATDQQDKASAVASNTGAYLPLEEDPSGSAPQMLDWTSNANHGTSHGSMTSGDLVAAQVANGLDLDGTDDNIDLASAASIKPTSAITLSILAKVTTHDTANGEVLVNRHDSSGPTDAYQLYIGPAGNVRFGINHSYLTGVTDVSGGSWFHIAGTWDGTTAKLYINGTEDTGGGASIGGPITYTEELPTILGGHSAALYFVTGLLDEFTLASVARSADWIAYDYQNIFNNSNTVTLGDEEVMESQVQITPVFFENTDIMRVR